MYDGENQNYCGNMKNPKEQTLSSLTAGKLVDIKTNLDSLEKHEFTFYHAQKNHKTQKIDELHFLLSELINQEKYLREWRGSHAEFIERFIRDNTNTPDALESWKERKDTELVKLNNMLKNSFEPVVHVINNQIAWLISSISDAERNVSCIIESFTKLTNLIMDMKRSILIAYSDLSQEEDTFVE